VSNSGNYHACNSHAQIYLSKEIMHATQQSVKWAVKTALCQNWEILRYEETAVFIPHALKYFSFAILLFWKNFVVKLGRSLWPIVSARPFYPSCTLNVLVKIANKICKLLVFHEDAMLVSDSFYPTSNMNFNVLGRSNWCWEKKHQVQILYIIKLMVHGMKGSN
jgi:hypothetical protein